MKLSHTDMDLKEFGDRVKSGFEDIIQGKKDDSCRDSHSIAASASLLQVSEFRCFQIAYDQWFGYELDEQSMENIFSTYIKEACVPHWVRHFTRKVLSLQVQGILDPNEFNIFSPANTRRNRIHGVCYTALMLVITVIFSIMLVS